MVSPVVRLGSTQHDLDSMAGLSEPDAIANLKRDGYNELPSAPSHIWQSADGKLYEIAAKGAPEAIADLCHFTPEQQQILTAQVSEMAAQGLRVLGVAKALDAPPPFLPPHPVLRDKLKNKVPVSGKQL